jgi:hypothetical protein
MHPLISLPLVIPLLTAIASLLTWRWQPGQSVLGVIGTAGLLGVPPQLTVVSRGMA